MARKPKATPSTEPELPVEAAQPASNDTATPARRGRKKAAAAASEPTPVEVDEEMDAESASPAPSLEDSAPARGRAGRKAKQKGQAAAPSPIEEALEQQPDTAAEPAVAGDDAMIAEMAYPASADGNSDTVAGEATPPSTAQDAAPAEKPAAQWDRATDTVRFDWAEIERTASQDGPNQVMAKLLVAARAEGANSRWPL